MWSGLGYYSRARNLHRAAKEIVARHDGEFPRSVDDALALPGIGSYTAAAVLSIAYNVPLAVLDGNVARVLARLGAVRGDLRHSATWRQLGERAQATARDQDARGLESGAHGTRRGNLHAAIATVRRMSDLALVQRTRAETHGRNSRIRKETRASKRPHRRCNSARPAGPNAPRARSRSARSRAVFAHVAIPRRRSKLPATRNRSLPHIYTQSLGLNAAPIRLEALPEARHGVTFRNITLLPFLARVARIPEAAAHTHSAARRPRATAHLERHAQNRGGPSGSEPSTVRSVSKRRSPAAFSTWSSWVAPLADSRRADPPLARGRSREC